MEKTEGQPIDNGANPEKAAPVDEGHTSDSDKPPDDIQKPVDHAMPDEEYISGIKLWLVIASVTLVCFLMMLDMSIIVTAIPRITSDFHSLSDVGWYGSAYVIANCVFQPLTGKFYSHFNTKYTFLVFLALFELGSVICGAAQSSNMLIIGRAVAGLGSSGMMIGALTIIGAAVPMVKRPVMMGIVMAVGQIGIVIAPLIGGALTQYTTWRWCFYINLPIGAVAAVFLLVIKIPNSGGKATAAGAPTLKSLLKSLDLVGFFLFAPLAVMFLMALEWGGTKYAWNSATIIGLFCGGGGMLLIFIAWEYRVGDGAMIPYYMVRQRIVWASCFVSACAFSCIFLSSYYLPIYFQSVRGASPSLSGVYVLPGILGQILAAIVSGVLVGKIGYYLPWSVASGVIVAIGSGLISTFTPFTPTAKWVGYQFLAGIGRGCGMQMPMVAVQNALAPSDIPVAMAVLAFSQTFAAAITLALAQTIFSHSLDDGLATYAPIVDAQEVLAAGATAFREVVKPEEVLGVLQAYNLGVVRVFYFGAGMAVGTFAFAWGIGWRNIKEKKEVVPEA